MRPSRPASIGRPAIQSSTGAGSTLSSPISESTSTTATAACRFVGSVTVRRSCSASWARIRLRSASS